MSSKSGTTTEMRSFFFYFWELLKDVPERGRHFVAVTDPGTPLEKLARERGFRAVVQRPRRTSAGATAPSPRSAWCRRRCSASTPAACSPAAAAWPRPAARDVTADDNPGLRLGRRHGRAGPGRPRQGHLRHLPLPGVLPRLDRAAHRREHGQDHPRGGRAPGDRAGRGRAAGSAGGLRRRPLLRRPAAPGRRRLARSSSASTPWRAAGHPVARFHLSDRYDLGAEMFRWEVATAAAGAVLGVEPLRSAGRAARQGAGRAR